VPGTRSKLTANYSSAKHDIKGGKINEVLDDALFIRLDDAVRGGSGKVAFEVVTEEGRLPDWLEAYTNTSQYDNSFMIRPIDKYIIPQKHGDGHDGAKLPEKPYAASKVIIRAWDLITNESVDFTINIVAVTDPSSGWKFITHPGMNIPEGPTGTAISDIWLEWYLQGDVRHPEFFVINGPSWLNIEFNGSDHFITGTRPNSAQEATTAVIEVRDDYGHGTKKSVTIHIGEVYKVEDLVPDSPTTTIPLMFTKQASFDVPTGTTGTAINAINVSTGVSGGKTPYTFTKTSGPSWLTVSSDGKITGTRPSTAQSATTAVISVKDANGTSKSITINVGTVSIEAVQTPPTTQPTTTVTPTEPTPTPPTEPPSDSSSLKFTHNSSFDVPSGARYTRITQINVLSGVSGGTTPYTFSIVNGPSWLKISSAGVLSGGREGTAAETTAVIQVKDAKGATATITIKVGAVT
jgi:hypothetical protein